MSAERDLAEAIHHEIISPERVDAAVATWQQNPQLDDRTRMWIVLANASGLSLDAVLARRQSEAARAGPWDEP
jgi:alkylhydroperoxidase/carboxymuconolactone decarboxylase family protein YurZ